LTTTYQNLKCKYNSQCTFNCFQFPNLYFFKQINASSYLPFEFLFLNTSFIMWFVAFSIQGPKYVWNLPSRTTKSRDQEIWMLANSDILQITSKLMFHLEVFSKIYSLKKLEIKLKVSRIPNKSSNIVWKVFKFQNMHRKSPFSMHNNLYISFSSTNTVYLEYIIKIFRWKYRSLHTHTYTYMKESKVY